MRGAMNSGKSRTKTEKRRKIELLPFHQNSLNPLDLSRLRQIVIKSGSRLLTEGFQSADSRGSYTLNGHDLSENCCDATGDRGSSGIWIRYNPLLSLLRDFCRNKEHRSA